MGHAASEWLQQCISHDTCYMAPDLCHPHTWPAQLVVLQKLQGVRLHCIWSGSTSPGHEAMSLAVPVSSTQVVVRFLTPPPHVLLQGPYSPTCSHWLRPEHMMMVQG